MTLRRIHRLATDMRIALEAIAGTLSSSQIKGFPHGACGDASILLGKYLEGNGCGIFEYCSCDYEGGRHGWLRRGTLVVDITADQFGKPELEKVIVQHNSPWHEERYNESCECNDWHTWFMESDTHGRDYRMLLAYIKTH